MVTFQDLVIDLKVNSSVQVSLFRSISDIQTFICFGCSGHTFNGKP